MSMAEEIEHIAARHRMEFAELRENITTAFRSIHLEHRQATRTNQEHVEEQEQTIYEQSAQAKDDQRSADSRLTIGFTRDDEPDAHTPLRRHAREDNSTRAVPAHGTDDEEETPPHTRPHRWHNDENVAVRDKNWGDLAKRYGNYNDEDE